MSWRDEDYWTFVGTQIVFTMGLVLGVGLACAAKTTGIDDSEKQETTVAGPSGETAAVGTGAQVSQITTGNIAIGGGWMICGFGCLLAWIVARHRRLAVERVYDCGVIASKDPKNFDKLIDNCSVCYSWRKRPKLDAPGRVIALAIKRATKK